MPFMQKLPITHVIHGDSHLGKHFIRKNRKKSISTIRIIKSLSN